MQIEIRDTHEIDASALSEIRFKSKGYWGYSIEILESWLPAMQITPDYIKENIVKNIYVDGALVGFYAIKQGPINELDHLWLLPEVIGKGVGREALAHATRCARELGISSLNIISDSDAEGFYLTSGAKRIGEFYSSIQNRMLPVLELTIRPKA